MKISIDFNTYLELEKISDGSFFPLKGFMEADDYFSVCEKMRLKNGNLFPLPVVLGTNEKEAKNIKINSELRLYYNNAKVGSILVKSVFKPNLLKYKSYLFGTNDINHPGYKVLNGMGTFFIGGPIIL